MLNVLAIKFDQFKLAGPLAQGVLDPQLVESGNYDGRLRSNRTCAKAILRRLMDLIKQHHAQPPSPNFNVEEDESG